MDYRISNADQEFLEHFRGFCRSEIAPAVEKSEINQSIPQSHYTKLGEIGYLGLMHKQEFGGQNASYVQATLAQVVLAEYCGSTFFSAGASAGLCGGPIAEYGTVEQKMNFLPALIKGTKIGALGVTEPDAGSDVQGLKTVAQETDDGYILNGQKTYITNAPICDCMLVLARLKSKEGKLQGLTHFIVTSENPGLTQGKPMRKMGLVASPTGELFFEDLILDLDAILGQPGRGFRITMQAFNNERLALAAYSVGVMRACLEASRSFSKTRKAFGRPIAKHQSVAFMLADMKTKLMVSELMLMETAWLFDKIYGSPASRNTRPVKYIHNGYKIDPTARAASVKLFASTHAREVTNLAVQVHGGAGFMEEYPVARMYRDIKLAEIGGGTSEIQKQIIARAELKRVPA